MAAAKLSQQGRSGDDLAAELRRMMSSGQLLPGIHLRQEELAARFSVSRSPVREALKVLVAEGSVEHDPNRGYFVATMASDEMRQLYALRQLVELEVLRSVRWPTTAELRVLQRFLTNMIKASQDGNYGRMAQEHRNMHFGVFDLSPKGVFVKEAKRLWGLTDRYRAMLLPELDAERVGAGEKLMLQALAEADRDALIEHFEEGRMRAEKMVLRLMSMRGV